MKKIRLRFFAILTVLALLLSGSLVFAEDPHATIPDESSAQEDPCTDPTHNHGEEDWAEEGDDILDEISGEDVQDMAE